VPARRQHRRAEALRSRNSNQKQWDMAPDLLELLALSLLAGFGFGLALARGDLLFVAVFGLASALASVRTGISGANEFADGHDALPSSV
jgi:hypothetical protein